MKIDLLIIIESKGVYSKSYPAHYIKHGEQRSLCGLVDARWRDIVDDIPENLAEYVTKRGKSFCSHCENLKCEIENPAPKPPPAIPEKYQRLMEKAKTQPALLAWLKEKINAGK